MGRRVWIVKKLTDKARGDAVANNCPEIAAGVPPVLAGKVGTLPCAFEEPDAIVEPSEPTLEERITALETANEMAG